MRQHGETIEEYDHGRAAKVRYCWSVSIEGGEWRFDKEGIHFVRDDGKEITVATVED